MTTAVSLPSRITISDDALFQIIENNIVWLEGQDEKYFRSDSVGLRLWQLFSENEEVEVAVRKMLDEYDVDESRLRQDMSEFIRKLVDAKLVHVD